LPQISRIGKGVLAAQLHKQPCAREPVFSVLWGRLLKQLEDNMVGQPDLDFTARRHGLKEVPNLGGR
jgi:hypothetical protein